MLHFPGWKIALIVGVLLWGALMALPNLFTDTALGIAPTEPATTDQTVLKEWRAEVAKAESSKWPKFLPHNKVNLGLDLQGGVYLLMEIDPNEVAANNLEVFGGDVSSTLGNIGKDGVRVFHIPEVVDGKLIIKLTKPDAPGPDQMEEGLRRIRALNSPVSGGLGGAKTYEVKQLTPNKIEISVTPAARDALSKEAQRKTLSIVARRVDPDGVKEISITPQGSTRIVLEAPGEGDPEQIKARLSRDGKMTFNLVDDSPSAIAAAKRGAVKPGYRLLKNNDSGEDLLIKNIPELTGAAVANAAQAFDQANNPKITFRLNGAGAKKFYNTTARNVNKRFAIVLDDVIMSAPVIKGPIPGGQVEITGRFTIEEATDLAAIIEAGELPAKVQFLEERTVGPSLGEASIRAGTMASLIGLVLVALFMLLAYGFMGGLADISLGVNIVLLLGSLSALGATLTLPGIAGIILTIGMAVDANVLVFERIREEQRAGRSPMTAVQAGYERALVTILDANITTLIAALILYMLGSGPVKGFAATLAIGIFTSVFTAFVFTRWLTVIWLKMAKPKKLAV